MEMKTRKHRHIHKYFLKDIDILKYLLGNDEKLETLIICKPRDVHFQTTDNEVYRAFGSLKSYDEVQRPRITKFFESVQISSSCKKLLTHDEVEEMRKKAVRKTR